MNKNSKQTWRRFLVPIAAIAIAVAYYCFVDAQFSVSGKPVFDLLMLMALLNLCLYCWLRLQSNWKLKTQVVVAAIACALQLFLLATVQLEGLHGNGRPVFGLRWADLPADNFKPVGSADFGPIEIPDEASWPQFRGPDRNGIASEPVSDWKTAPPELMWKQAIGAGWSSFAVAGDYCFTLEQRGDEECLVCYQVSDGQQVWVNSWAARFSELSGGEGPRGTPTFDEGLLYSLGATGILRCVDATDGKTVWEKDILAGDQAKNCIFGMCGSPLVTDGKVIVSPGGEATSLIAFDQTDGNLIWQNGNADASYSSPVRMSLCGVEQILIFNGDGLFSHDLESGEVLWSVDWLSNEEEKNNVCQPIQLDEDEVLLSSAYGMGCARIRLQNDGGDWSTSFVWKNKNLKSKFSSAIFDGQNIFGLDLGILVCLNAETGARDWKKGRYAHGQFVLAGDHLIVQSEKGFLAQVIATADGFRETGRVKALRYRTWTHPVVADGVLLIRNDREMAAYRLR